MSIVSRSVAIAHLVLLSGCLTGQGTPVTCTVLPKDDKTFLYGRGEGTTYEEAKALAATDAVSKIGMNIISVLMTSSNLNSVQSEHRITQKVFNRVEGFEVVRTCSKNHLFEVIGSIPKKPIVDSIKLRSDARNGRIEEIGRLLEQDLDALRIFSAKQEIKNIDTAESNDTHVALILGYPMNIAPLNLKQVREELSRRWQKVTKEIAIQEPKDEISKGTLPILQQYLVHQEWLLMQTTNVASRMTMQWACTVVKAAPVGDNVSFEVNCSLGNGFGRLFLINKKGFARVSDVSGLAIRAIEKQISNHQ